MPTFNGGPGEDTLEGASGADTISGESGHDLLIGNRGDDLLYGGAGDDFLVGDVNDQYYSIGADRLEGGEGDDVLHGGAGADTLNGGEGDDDIHSGIGYYSGGERPYWGSGGNLLFDGGNDVIDGGAGHDRAELIFSRIAGITLDMSAAGAVHTIYADGVAAGSITGVEELVFRGTFGSGADRVTGGAFSDLLSGGGGDDLFRSGNGIDQLVGGDGADALHGDAANDLLEGGEGDDLLDGGEGFDTASYEQAVAGVTVRLGVAGAQDTVSAGIDTLAGMEALTGSFHADRLYGDDGDNRLDGGVGDDWLEGGLGDDLYRAAMGDRVVERAGEGMDTVEAFGSFTLAANVENLILGWFGLTGIGNSGRNTLTSNMGSSRLEGGKGDDIYYVDSTDIVVELAGGGSDIVNSSSGFSLAGIEVEVLNLVGQGAANGIGNDLNNRIVGNGHDNVLLGGGGNDRLDGGYGENVLRGGIGNDVYVVRGSGDRIEEYADQGFDTVEAWYHFSLAGQYVEAIRLMGEAHFNATGNSLANTLVGNAGSNRLDGGGGADLMEGGNGSDTYVVDNAGDRLVELAGDGGWDTVLSSISFGIAGQYIEELRLTGSAAINGAGNSLHNFLYGNAADNVLRGEGGSDYLYGGLGNDTLIGGDGSDAFRFDTAPGAGNVDRIIGFGDFDQIDLDVSVYAGLPVGPSAQGAFRLGTAALDADDRILYDAATGNLWYDADGVGGAAAVRFAIVEAGTDLRYWNFHAIP